MTKPVVDFAAWMKQIEKRVLRLERRPAGSGAAGPGYTGPTITVSVTAPPTPDEGDVWIEVP